ncbi:MAG: NUDIX domain-containing protein [Lachnospiraceae bacterium]|nr:NUDIX domain-containing protein [Lachnospiraceae bacterium]
MDYCMFCGTRLHEKELEGEGMIPFCDKCNEFRFPVFNTAVSMIVTNESKDRIMLIKQYGRDRFILVAGYVNKGEDAEDAVKREIMEELGLKVKSMSFNHSRYFKPSNTLMLNFTAVVDEGEPKPNNEVDHYEWFSPDEARENIYKGSLAESFLLGYLDGKYNFKTYD